MAETAALWLSQAVASAGAAQTAASIASAAPAIGSAFGSAGTVFSGLSAASSLLSAGQQANAARSEAKIAEFQGRQEEIRGKEEANSIRERLVRTLASQRAAYAASGVDLSGSASDVMDETFAAGDRELDTSRDNTVLRASQKRLEANQLRSAASSTLLGGVANAGATLAARRSLGGPSDGGTPRSLIPAGMKMNYGGR
jgi:hypothetical protein